MSKRGTLQAVLDKFSENKETGCLEWMGGVNNKGYGTLSLEGRTWFSHQLVYFISKGPTEDGLEICHSCDNPRVTGRDPTTGYAIQRFYPVHLNDEGKDVEHRKPVCTEDPATTKCPYH